MMNITSQYVIDMCNNYTTLKPCPKRSVYALVVTADGQHYCGANWITNECVTVCPRVEGDLYEKCKSVCVCSPSMQRRLLWTTALMLATLLLVLLCMW